MRFLPIVIALAASRALAQEALDAGLVEDAGVLEPDAGEPAPTDPDGLPEGASPLKLEPRTDGHTALGVARDDVDFDRGDGVDWWRLEVTQAGSLEPSIRLDDRTAKVRADLYVRAPEDGGEPQRIKPGLKVRVAPGPVWIKVFALGEGEASRYTLSVAAAADRSIVGQVVTLVKGPVCVAMAARGSNDGVRVGMPVEILDGATLLAQGVTDQVFAALTRVRVPGRVACGFGPGATVRIRPFE